MVTPEVVNLVRFYEKKGDEPKAAIVVAVHEDCCVNLVVFNPDGTTGLHCGVIVKDGDKRPENNFCELT